MIVPNCSQIHTGKPYRPYILLAKDRYTPEDEGPFTLDEFNHAIDTLKRNKASGTDEPITELFKNIQPHNKAKLLDLYNQIYDEERIPDHFNEALVVQIHKPGEIPEHFANYRPIAFLNTTYKIFAKMLQERLRSTLDHKIVEFQFGYRQRKSTAEPSL